MKTKPWSIQHKQRYTWLFNYISENYNDAEEETYIDNNRRELMSIIENNENWSSSTKQGFLFMISRYLFNKNNSDRYIKLYSEKGYQLLQKSKTDDEKNEQDDKEMINYRDNDYFVKILNDIDYNEIQTIEGHYKYLLLYILTYQPVLRTSFYTTAKFLRLLKDDDHVDNFIWINRRGKIKVTFIVNKDKATNYRVYSMNKKLSYIDVENNKLVELINDSFTKYPRTYLFEIIKGNPITSPTLLSWLRKITGVDAINIDMMRSSYINHFYKDKSKTFLQKDQLANKMRHSQTTAQRNYLKVFQDDDKTENSKETIKELRTQILILENKLKAYESVPPIIDDKKYQKLRYDILYNLNVKKQKSKESSLTKYNIKFDENTNKYV
jgi:hypothetical protein